MKTDGSDAARLEVFNELVQTIAKMGYPMEFGVMVARNLGGEKTMRRMIGYLRHAKPRSAEEIADEMLSIMDDRARWVQKKSAEYYNSKYNELLYYGLGTDEDGDDDRNEDSGEDSEDGSEDGYGYGDVPEKSQDL